MPLSSVGGKRTGSVPPASRVEPVFHGQALAGAGFSITELITENGLCSKPVSPSPQPSPALLCVPITVVGAAGRAELCAHVTGRCPGHHVEEDTSQLSTTRTQKGGFEMDSRLPLSTTRIPLQPQG